MIIPTWNAFYSSVTCMQSLQPLCNHLMSLPCWMILVRKSKMLSNPGKSLMTKTILWPSVHPKLTDVRQRSKLRQKQKYM